ncbi:MAG: tetratricopeptide (TPR) repeat protein [Gammaproteobacteria bacterium]|jgi:tetratricopeptide (TPR) repeat protein
MAKDAQGHSLSGANAAAAEFIDEAVRAFTLNYGDLNASLAAVQAQSPQCKMADILRAWVPVLSNDPAQLASAAPALAQMSSDDMNERESAHLAALQLAVDGRWPSVVATLDRHLMSYPHDLAAHQIAMRFDGYQGRFPREAGRAARALPFWSDTQPGYAIMLSFYGFGLEESGDYARAEDIARRAAELEPYGYWPHHTVSHVLEMTGRPDAGVAWMESRESFWSSPQHTNRVHFWWHKALFHIELGQFDTALALYDKEIAATLRPVGNSLCNPTSLLWRLETLGCDAGQRWQPLFELWQDRANGKTSPFNDIHAAMTALRAGQTAAFESLLLAMRETSVQGGELAPAYRDLAVPAVEAIAQFTHGNYGDAVGRLLAVRAELWRMGGSIAQRDLLDWTLTMAAMRARLPGVARSLANERLSLRPDSTINRQFQQQAQAI